MKVLIVSQYFHPERTAAAFRLRPLAAGLAARGHQVRVVCEAPSHPEGKLHEGYGGSIFDRRSLDGFDATYVRTAVPSRPGARGRLLSYASYAAAAVPAALRGPRPDVILASSPPLSVGAVGMTVAKLFRRPWVFDVRDLWPEVAVALGEIPADGRVAAAATRLEHSLYRSAAAITVPTISFAGHISRIVGEGKIHHLANGTSASSLRAGDLAETAAGPSDPFVWTYAGNVGLSQNLDVAVEAAAELGDGFQLRIVGEGASRSGLEQRARELEAPVEFIDPVDLDRAAELMSRSDALLVSLADDAVLARTVPVKLYDSCAVGSPVIVAAPGEPYRLAKDRGIGLPVAPGDRDALVEAVRALKEDPALAERLISEGRAFAIENARDRQVEPLEKILEGVA